MMVTGCKLGSHSAVEVEAPGPLPSADSTSVESTATDSSSARLVSREPPVRRETHLDAYRALSSWPFDDGPVDDWNSVRPTWRQYHEYLGQMIVDASRNRSINVQRGMTIAMPDGKSGFVEIDLKGFAWQPDDFDEFFLAADYRDSKLNHQWHEPGLGVPLVVVRHESTKQPQPGFGRSVPFAATAVLRPVEGTLLSETSDDVPLVGVLELSNPLRVKRVRVGPDKSVALTRDITAPLAFATHEVHRHKLRSFLRPSDDEVGNGICMIEPHEPGRIPIVFVHGLLSDKFTWIDLVNDLRSVDGFTRHYEIWAFQYATGQSFQYSAAKFRRELRDLIHHLDPDGSDPGLKDVVLVGHSMGGLVSKLQVTESGNALWDSLASRPFRTVDADPQEHDLLEAMFFFKPVANISRVVFIGTPHRGSVFAQTLIGRLGSKLVHAPRDRVEMVAKLIRDNPDLFPMEITQRVPTSVDMLRPDSAILSALYDLSIRPGVKVHTVIGTEKALAGDNPGDGVVSVASARHPRAVSEKLVHAKHTELTESDETFTELVRIFREHLHELDPKHTADSHALTSIQSP